MCGIAGLFAYGAGAPPVDVARLERMREAMALRGPDGAGTWVGDGDRIGLAHRRLAIIDLTENGAQPMLSTDGRLAITFNGEIYNYRTLQAELAQAGANFVSTCDTEVLLHLYRRYGPDMVHRLRGMYAFAIWDETRQGVFAARDPFGIKPLYYADDGATFAFASQVKALTAGGGIDMRAEAAGHAGFLVFGYVPEPFTLYRGIRALPSGTAMWIDRQGRKDFRVHFDMSAEIRAAEQAARDTPPARNGLREALTDSVAHHLIADVPVGVFLSSGLDSATVTALAAELQPDSLRTVTLAFQEYRDRPEDEAPLAEAIARQYGAAHQTRVLSSDDFAAELDTIVKAMDQPSIDGVNTYFVSKVTAATGLKVALSGLGGDELFGGYSTFSEIPRLTRALAPFRRARAVGRALRTLTHPIFRRVASPKYAGLLEFGTDYPGAYLLRRALHMPWELGEVLDPAFARQGLQTLDLEGALRRTTAGINSPRLKVTALESQWYMRNQLLRDSDWAGMAHSLEIRTPLVDVALFRAVLPQLAAAAPPGKQDMARTPRTPLPAQVLSRTKTGFLVPVREWVARGSPEAAAARGYRGWAHIVYRRAAEQQPRALRVLFLVHDAFGGRGGIAKFNRDFVSALAAWPSGAEITVVPRYMPDPPEAIPSGVRWLTASLGGKAAYLAAALGTAWFRRYDAIVSGNAILTPFAHLCRAGRRIPLVLIAHGIDAWQPTGDKLVDASVRATDFVIAVSGFTRGRLAAWSGIREDRIMVLPNCVDLSLYGPGAPRVDLQARYGVAGKTVLLTLGRLVARERYKGMDEVIELLPELIKLRPDLVYMIAGDGGDRARLEAKARALGVADRLVFTGYVDESEKPDHYRLARAFALAGRGEGFGIVLLEAMACGVPVVASRRDGSAEAVQDGKLGLLADPDDLADLKRALLAALDRPVGRVPEGLRDFAYPAFADRVHDIIRRIVAAP